MNQVGTDNRAPFFPDKKDEVIKNNNTNALISQKKSRHKDQLAALESAALPASSDTSVDISEGLQDFTRIKKAASNAPFINNEGKIKDLKERIAKGQYNVDYDKVAENFLKEEIIP